MLNPCVNHAVPDVPYSLRGMETMGDRIRQLRQARGLNQPQLAKLVGVTKSAVNQWESGSTQNIRLTHFMSLLRALGTDAPYLIWGPDRAPEHEAQSLWNSKPARR
jgi:transcriptional regulator with XRE-family HTH domain